MFGLNKKNMTLGNESLNNLEIFFYKIKQKNKKMKKPKKKMKQFVKELKRII